MIVLTASFIIGSIAVDLNEVTEYAELDHHVVEYFDHLFREGYGVETAGFLLAAIGHTDARYSKHGPLSLPRAKRASTGWGELLPGRTRQAMPWLAFLAILRVPVACGHFEAALMLALTWATFCRPAAS